MQQLFFLVQICTSPSECVCVLWSASIYFVKELRSLEVATVKVTL